MDRNEEWTWEAEVETALESMGLYLGSHKSAHAREWEANREAPADYWDREYYDD